MTVFTDTGAGVRAAVRGRIEALAVQEIVLDEPDVDIMAQRLGIDKPLPGKGLVCISTV